MTNRAALSALMLMLTATPSAAAPMRVALLAAQLTADAARGR